MINLDRNLILILQKKLNSSRVLVTLTPDVGKIISKLHQVKPNGNVDLIRGIKVANVIEYLTKSF